MTQREYESLQPGDSLKRVGARGRVRRVIDPGKQWCSLEPVAQGGKNESKGFALYSVWEIRTLFKRVTACKECGGTGPFREGRKTCKACEAGKKRKPAATAEQHAAT
jgi:hypothetical protein